MFKNIILSIFIVFATFAFGTTVPRVTHEDYVHWTVSQKQEFHIKVMQLAVDLESAYKRETAKSGFSQERFEKYVLILKTIQSQLLIPEAYARENLSYLTHSKKKENPSWDEMAKAFGELSTRDSKNGEGNCLFAGWISQVRKTGDGKTICAHPNFVANSSSTVTSENLNYPDRPKGSECDRLDKNHIQCNPVVFGYKKAAEKSLFCVSTEERAENASFLCMQKALQEEGDSSTDSRADRMKHLSERYQSNSSAFETVFKFNYKTCICSVPQPNFNKKYQDYMRPGSREKNKSDRYRTCYGLMNMMAEAVNNCSLPIEDKTIFQSFSEFINHKRSETGVEASGPDADSFYNDFIRTNVTKTPASIVTYNKLCGTSLPVPKIYACKADCTKAVEGKSATCIYDVFDTTDPTTKIDAKPEKDPTESETSVIIKHKDLPADGLTCVVDWKDASKDYECKATCDKPVTSTAQASATSSDASNEKVLAQSTQYSCVYDVYEKGDPSKKLDGAQPDQGPASTEIKEILVKHEKLPATGLKCNLEWKDAPVDTPKGAEPTINVSIKLQGATHYTVLAKTTNEADYKFDWYVEKPDGVTVEEAWKASATTVVATPGLATGLDETAARAPAAAATETTGDSEKSREVKQKRVTQKYKVCGKLTKNDKVISDCVEIDPIAATTPAPTTPSGNFNINPQGPQMPQQQMRGASDTSAVGIK